MSAATTEAHFPDRCPVALVLIDLINDFGFEGGHTLQVQAVALIEPIATLKRTAQQHHVPVIYANDNFGRWRSDFRQAVQRCLADDCLGKPLAERLQPDENDYFVLKPKYSAFFGTTLEVLLKHLGTDTLILTGIAGDMCIAFTAGDAFMRGYRLFVPADGIASIDPRENAQALRYFERVLKADTRPSTALSALLPRLKVASS